MAFNLEPTEILLDSTNLPSFDEQQFEGRIERPLSKKLFARLALGFLLVGLVLVARAADLQIRRGEDFLARSENNTLRQTLLFSPRGIVYDRLGQELAWNTPERQYIAAPGLSHLLGYINFPTEEELTAQNYYPEERIGREGVEKALNQKLQGEAGLKIEEQDVRGEVLSDHIVRLPTAGESVFLSIDSRLQEKLFSEIFGLVDEGRFRAGAGLIWDIKTGEILALTNVPAYDPNILAHGEDKEAIQKYLTDPRSPFLNRAINGLYTPGSIIKPLIAIAALNEGVVRPEKEIVSTGSISVPNPFVPGDVTIFKDWKAHGAVDLREAIAVSSNVYFFSIGGGYGDQKGVGIKKIAEYAELFGFNRPTEIELVSEETGVIPTPEWKEKVFAGEPWRLGDTYNVSIGQYGWQVTPIQIARMIAAVARSGVLVAPTLERGEGEPIFDKIDKVAEEHYRVVREGMRQAVLHGTAKGLNMDAVAVAAKTGTAEIGPNNQEVNSWAAGFFPYENPRFVFTVVMEKGKRNNLIGGVFVMRRVFDWLAREAPEYLLGQLPTTPVDVAVDSE